MQQKVVGTGEMLIQRITFLAVAMTTLTWSIEALACKPFPPVTSTFVAVSSPPGAPRSKTALFAQSADLDLCDGQGNMSNHIKNLNITLVATRGDTGIEAMAYVLGYQFYNGSGTTGGSQYLVFTFLDSANNILPLSWTTPTDRGGCTKDGIWATGGTPIPDPAIQDLFDQIASVSLIADAVQGPQAPC